MDRRRLLAGAGALAASLALSGVAAATCTNIEISYCNKLIQSGSWCSEGSGTHSYSDNGAHYDGGGTVYVCQRMLGDVSGSTYSFTCGNNAAFGHIADNCDTLIDVASQNESASQHTIRGAASY